MSYRHTCGYDGGKGWVVARTTRDYALVTYDEETEEWGLDDEEIKDHFPANPYVGGGDCEISPEYHVSCPQCGVEMDEADLQEDADPQLPESPAGDGSLAI